MSEPEMIADFAMRYPGGAEVRANLRRPADGFSVTLLFGPSGGGKTTVLRCLAGLERPWKGSIRFGNDVWFDATDGVMLPPQQRRVGYVSQEYALFPHLSVAENVGYALWNLPRDERRRKVAEVLEQVGLAGLEERLPGKLSGGQQQRVALARALAWRPRLLLLDEPLSALDLPTREELRRDLRRLLSDAAIPVFLVTHDRIEAIALADHLAVMIDGNVAQQGSVQEVFSKPANVEVARVVGVDAVEAGEILRVEEGLATVRVGDRELLALAGDATPGRAYVCIRAEDVVVQKVLVASSARNQLDGVVRGMEREGPMVRVRIDCGMRLSALITRLAWEELDLQVGNRVIVALKAPAIHLIAHG